MTRVKGLKRQKRKNRFDESHGCYWRELGATQTSHWRGVTYSGALFRHLPFIFRRVKTCSRRVAGVLIFTLLCFPNLIVPVRTVEVCEVNENGEQVCIAAPKGLFSSEIHFYLSYIFSLEQLTSCNIIIKDKQNNNYSFFQQTLL